MGDPILLFLAAVWLCQVAFCTVIQRQHLGLVVVLKHVVCGSPKIPILFLFGCVFLLGSPNNSERAMRAAGEMCKGSGAARAL